MAVRNCYASVRADGRDTVSTCGPSRKDGGLSAVFTVRENGSISDDTLEVHFLVSRDGKTIVRYVTENGREISRKEFTR